MLSPFTNMKHLLRWDLTHFRGDLFGGITAGIVAFPLALAFGAQTELGAIAGLYGAIALGVLAAMFGGTPTQISGPTAPMTVVSAVVIAKAIAFGGGIEEAMPLIVATFLLGGLIELLFGIIGAGRYIKYIPYPVVSGFMSGIGVIIIITQIFPLLGAPSPAGGTLGVVMNLGRIPEIFNGYAVLLAAATIAIIYFFPKITKAVPGSLIALILISGLAYVFLRDGQVSLIADSTPGGVPKGLPKLQLSFWAALIDPNNLAFIVQYGFTLAALGAIDSLLTSVIADNLSKTKHDSNQELVGQGLGNMAAALLGGLPGAGATMRTVINIQSGGRTRIAGVVAGLLLLAILLGLGPLVGNIPNAVLAGILLTVGIGIIDYKGFNHIRSIPRADAVIMLLVLAITVFVGLLEAVAIGLILAALLFMKNIADVVEGRTLSAPLQTYAQELPWADEDQDLLRQFGDLVFIKHLDGPLFFGFASRFQEIIQSKPHIQIVIIRMGRVPYVDQSGLYALEEAVSDLHAQNITVAVSGLRGQPKDMLAGINLVPGLVPAELNFPTFQDCSVWLKQNLQNRIQS